MNFLSFLKDKHNVNDTLVFSIDDKSKVKIGVPAVSRYVHSKKYFEINNGPTTPDHDFPIGEKMLITPSGNKLETDWLIKLGYLELELQTESYQDKQDRTTYPKPRHGQLHIFNRAFHFMSTTAFTHARDIYKIIQEKEQKPAILALLSDNGNDFSPNNYYVFIALGRLWKCLNLDQLILASFAPYHSRYNPIEIAWGTMNIALAQTILCKDTNVKVDTQAAKVNVFRKAMTQLDTIWGKTSYAQKLVKSSSVDPLVSIEDNFSDYEHIKDVLENLGNSAFYDKYKSEIKFLFRHCYRRNHFLHFRRCYRLNCTHCNNTQKHPEAFDILDGVDDSFGTLLKPILIKQVYEGKHYPNFIDYQKSLALRDKIQEELKQDSEKEEKCHFCYWHFQSDNDKKRHLAFCAG